MQIATRSMYRVSRSNCPRSDGMIGARRLRSRLPASIPRAAMRWHAQPAKLIRDSGFLPDQIQQVLRRCAGAGISVLSAPECKRAAALMSGMPVIRDGAPDAKGATQRQAGEPGVTPVAQPYDPYLEHAGGGPAAAMLTLSQGQPVHFRKLPLCYTLASGKPWRLLLGGVDMAAIERDAIDCASIEFPADTLVQVNLPRGMLHGFEGTLGGVCTAWPRPDGWRAQPGASSALAWPASTVPDAAKVRVIADRAIPWQLVRHWQREVPAERSADAFAWQMALRML